MQKMFAIKIRIFKPFRKILKQNGKYLIIIR